MSSSSSASSASYALQGDLLLRCFEWLENTELGRAAVTCKEWNSQTLHDQLWQSICLRRWKRWLTIPLFDSRAEFMRRRQMEANCVDLLPLFADPTRRSEAMQQVERMEPHVCRTLWEYCTRDPWNALTSKYYARRLCLRIITHWCIQTLRDILRDEGAPIERGAIAIAQWAYPLLREEDVTRQLDSIASAVRSRLDSESTAMEIESIERPEERILNAINIHLFTDLQFNGNTTSYYEPENSFLNDVIRRRTGIPISLSILYSAIATRLGLQIDMVGFPKHFLIKVHGGDLFIDPFNNGRMLRKEDCFTLMSSMGIPRDELYLEEIRPKDVYVRMLNNLMFIYRDRCNTDLLLSSLELVVSLSSVSTRERTFKAQLENYLAIREQDFHEAPKYRTCPIRYSVGTVIRQTNFGVIGVVFGWDTMLRESIQTRRRENFADMRLRRDQPFYNVLFHDSGQGLQQVYVGEDELEPVVDIQPINNSELGRYFDRFDGTRYVPNADLRRLYPDDANLIN